jgi:hypothetical protein
MTPNMLYANAEKLNFYKDNIILFTEQFNPTYPETLENRNLQLKESKKYNGYLSVNSQKRIMKILINWMLALNFAREKKEKKDKKKIRNLIFVTLTISDITASSHTRVKREMLALFLKQICYQFNVKNYFWKAELQKRGQLHFHLIVDSYIAKNEIQERWNKIQKKAGFLELFYKKYGRYNPPSTHVRFIDNYREAIDYALKYVSKYSPGKKIEGRLFSFSEKLLGLKSFNIYLSEIDVEYFKEFLSLYADKTVNSDYFTLFDFAGIDYFKLLPPGLYRKLSSYYQDMYYSLYPLNA